MLVKVMRSDERNSVVAVKVDEKGFSFKNVSGRDLLLEEFFGLTQWMWLRLNSDKVLAESAYDRYAIKKHYGMSGCLDVTVFYDWDEVWEYYTHQNRFHVSMAGKVSSGSYTWTLLGTLSSIKETLFGIRYHEFEFQEVEMSFDFELIPPEPVMSAIEEVPEEEIKLPEIKEEDYIS